MLMRLISRLCALFLLFVLSSSFASARDTKTMIQPHPCSDNEQRQFDFWLGEWDLTWPGDSSGAVAHGTNSIQRVMDGCVVQENFSGGTSDHLRGMSMSTYVPQEKKWKQTWVDNEGSYLDFSGGYRDGEMSLFREGIDSTGRPVHMRMVFKNITANDFDWSWEKSSDGGESWHVVWPIHYRRKASTAKH